MSQIYNEKIKYFFNQLSATNLSVADGFYHQNINFIDPLVNLRGLDAVKGYYQHVYQPVQMIHFDFADFINEDEKVSFSWTMQLQVPKLNGGKPFKVEGMSQLVFDRESALVVYHRDYYDLGEFIYERLSVLSWIIRQIKKRLISNKQAE